MANPKQKTPEVKTIEQLREELTTLRHDYNESRKSHAQGELVNPHILTVQRRNIARLLTTINRAETTAVKEDK